MVMTIANVVRERILADALNEPFHVVAARYGVSTRSVKRIHQRWLEAGTLAPRPHGGGVKPKMSSVDLALLRRLVADEPNATALKLRERYLAAGGTEVAPNTIHRALTRLGLARRRMPREKERAPVTPRPPTYRRRPARPLPSGTERGSYPSDLNDGEWARIEPLLPPPAEIGRGRPCEIARRDLVDAMLYVLRTGCQWRALPHDFPNWCTVYWYFRQWKLSGLFERLNDVLRRRVRRDASRNEEASAWIVDSQTAKTTETPGERGFEGGKRITGRKRNIIVDTLGMLIAVTVVPASVHDLPAGLTTMQAAQAPPPRVLFADSAYQGPQARDWLAAHGGGDLAIVRRPPCQGYFEAAAAVPEATGFKPLPKRWIVERTFAWTSRNRRLAKDYEGCASTARAWMLLAMIALMARRMAPDAF